MSKMLISKMRYPVHQTMGEVRRLENIFMWEWLTVRLSPHLLGAPLR